MSEYDEKRCKVCFCKCGLRVSRATALPEGDTDMDILKEYATAAEAGRKIDYMTVKEMKELFGGCFNGECWKQKSHQLNIQLT